MFDDDEAVARAAGMLNEGLALCPGDPILLMGLGYHHLRWGDRPAARRLFSEVQGARPQRRDALLALAGALSLDGEHLAAAQLYERALLERALGRGVSDSLGQVPPRGGTP